MLDVASEGLPPRVLLGTFGEAPGVLQNGLAFLPCRVLRAGSEGTLEEMMVAQRPDAVLLDAGEFYLEGRPLLLRLRAVLPGIRILFLDVEDTWALWVDCEPGEHNDFCVTPCRSWEASTMLFSLLREHPLQVPTSVFEAPPGDTAAA